MTLATFALWLAPKTADKTHVKVTILSCQFIICWTRLPMQIVQFPFSNLKCVVLVQSGAGRTRVHSSGRDKRSEAPLPGQSRSKLRLHFNVLLRIECPKVRDVKAMFSKGLQGNERRLHKKTFQRWNSKRTPATKTVPELALSGGGPIDTSPGKARHHVPV